MLYEGQFTLQISNFTCFDQVKNLSLVPISPPIIKFFAARDPKKAKQKTKKFVIFSHFNFIPIDRRTSVSFPCNSYPTETAENQLIKKIFKQFLCVIYFVLIYFVIHLCTVLPVNNKKLRVFVVIVKARIYIG